MFVSQFVQWSYMRKDVLDMLGGGSWLAVIFLKQTEDEEWTGCFHMQNWRFDSFCQYIPCFCHLFSGKNYTIYHICTDLRAFYLRGFLQFRLKNSQLPLIAAISWGGSQDGNMSHVPVCWLNQSLDLSVSLLAHFWSRDATDPLPVYGMHHCHHNPHHQPHHDMLIRF